MDRRVYEYERPAERAGHLSMTSPGLPPCAGLLGAFLLSACRATSSHPEQPSPHRLAASTLSDGGLRDCVAGEAEGANDVGGAGTRGVAASAVPARVALQSSVDIQRYLGRSSDGRFAVFEDGIVDLKSRRIAWRTEPISELIHVETRPDRLVRIRTEGEVEIFDLIGGHSVVFPGKLASHCDIRRQIALRREDSIDLIDTVDERLVASLPVDGQVLSVVATPKEWHMLVSSNEGASLSVRTYSRASRRQTSVRAIHLTGVAAQLGPADERHSGPFLVVSSNTELSVAVVIDHGMAGLAVHTSPVKDLAGHGGRPWSAAAISPASPPRFELPQSGPQLDRQRDGYAVAPPEIVELVSNLPHADYGVGHAISTNGDYIVTGNQTRECVWSLDEARRLSCRGALQVLRFLDNHRVWLGGTLKERRIGIWSLDTQSVEMRPLGSDTYPDPAPTGDRYLASRFASNSTWLVELWTWIHPRPDWTYEPCAAQPTWNEPGTEVLCPEMGNPDVSLALSPTNGSILGRRSSKPRTGEVQNESCGFKVMLDAVMPLCIGERCFATLYDLTASEWAIVLPDGRFAGTHGVDRYLAFYDTHGALLSDAQVAALRDAKAVREAMGAARRASRCPARQAATWSALPCRKPLPDGANP